jgi:release factor glutamine methyltransferase
LGEAEFFGRTFAVRPGVFIPRPETEVVVEAALTRLRALAQRLGRPLRLLDVGTGSGCIAVTLARALPACAVVGIEVSWGALQVAAANARRHGVSERVHWVHGRGLEPFSPGARFDGLLSNPPYVPSGLVQQLPLDVRREPSESLDGGPDGMRELVGLLGGAPQLLNPGGVMALECGEDQAEPLLRAARGARWAAESAALGDLTGRPRGVLIVRAWTNS